MTQASGSEPLVGDGVLRAAATITVITAAGCGVAALLMEGDPAVYDRDQPDVARVPCRGGGRRPDRCLGQASERDRWLLLLCVFLQTVSLVTAGYAEIQYATGHPGAGSFLAASIAEWAWFPSLVLPVAVLPSLYPTGRAETRLRRLFVWAGVLGIVGFCAGDGADPRPHRPRGRPAPSVHRAGLGRHRAGRVLGGAALRGRGRWAGRGLRPDAPGPVPRASAAALAARGPGAVRRGVLRHHRADRARLCLLRGGGRGRCSALPAARHPPGRPAGTVLRPADRGGGARRGRGLDGGGAAGPERAAATPGCRRGGRGPGRSRVRMAPTDGGPVRPR